MLGLIFSLNHWNSKQCCTSRTFIILFSAYSSIYDIYVNKTFKNNHALCIHLFEFIRYGSLVAYNKNWLSDSREKWNLLEVFEITQPEHGEKLMDSTLKEQLGFRTSSVVMNTCCSSRGPLFDSLHPDSGSQLCHYIFRGSDNLFWLLYALYASDRQTYKDKQNTHTHNIF